MPAASYALLPNLKKGLFLPSERDREVLSPVFYTAAPKCVCIRRLAGARHVSPAVSLTLRPEGGSEPLTSATRSDFVAQSLVLSIASVENSESRRFELTFGWVLLRPILTQHLPGNVFFRLKKKNGIFFSKICAHSGRKSCGGIFAIQTFLWQHRVSVVIGLTKAFFRFFFHH